MKNKDKDYTSYTGLSGIDGYLRHVPPFIGNEGFLVLGRELHAQWLEGKTSGAILNERQKAQLQGMLKSLNNHKVAMQVHKGSDKEVLFAPGPIHDGIKLKVIMDLHKKRKKGADLKTTSSRNKEGFIKAAVEFGYFGQIYIYKKVSGLEEFFIISVQKEEPHTVFVLDHRDYPAEYKKAQQKMDFLIYVFKNHRNDIDL